MYSQWQVSCEKLLVTIFEIDVVLNVIAHMNISAFQLGLCTKML